METQTADQVVRARQLIEQWLTGDPSRQSHADMCISLRELLRIDLLNHEIEDIFYDAVDRELGPTAVVVRLVESDAVDDVRSQQGAKPR